MTSGELPFVELLEEIPEFIIGTHVHSEPGTYVNDVDAGVDEAHKPHRNTTDGCEEKGDNHCQLSDLSTGSVRTKAIACTQHNSRAEDGTRSTLSCLSVERYATGSSPKSEVSYTSCNTYREGSDANATLSGIAGLGLDNTTDTSCRGYSADERLLAGSTMHESTETVSTGIGIKALAGEMNRGLGTEVDVNIPAASSYLYLEQKQTDGSSTSEDRWKRHTQATRLLTRPQSTPNHIGSLLANSIDMASFVPMSCRKGSGYGYRMNAVEASEIPAVVERDISDMGIRGWVGVHASSNVEKEVYSGKRCDIGFSQEYGEVYRSEGNGNIADADQWADDSCKIGLTMQGALPDDLNHNTVEISASDNGIDWTNTTLGKSERDKAKTKEKDKERGKDRERDSSYAKETSGFFRRMKGISSAVLPKIDDISIKDKSPKSGIRPQLASGASGGSSKYKVSELKNLGSDKERLCQETTVDFEASWETKDDNIVQYRDVLGASSIDMIATSKHMRTYNTDPDLLGDRGRDEGWGSYERAHEKRLAGLKIDEKSTKMVSKRPASSCSQKRKPVLSNHESLQTLDIHYSDGEFRS
ncbi:hypothetical protein SARC_12335 [Sphaeroforma arctica JP610]|uniref:Uncharacterized protein n=1 Tax=Sphaeroforma arctica JP610 TaxID=667725 RepID=A0A0L0FGH7_9EUKA|nr:hypothetical protein SARC_12335 [Sphaeroforma arctica JP610]KNC75133.1 hypothetical protein SARC_12335 [Sphaeroforma arctica JP610]|eukprot:XP_014149035.1 hypothetical protein SARC_12335 [Sphaeroforma arctica JP610]